MKRKDLYMGTTEIEPIRTIGEIHAYLVRMGALRIMNTYENGEPVSVHFGLRVGGSELSFELPARVDPVYKIIRSDVTYRSRRSASDDLAQAKRTAWRQIYRWIQAQLALIETGMACPEEVFMPYMQVAGENGEPTTLYQRAALQGFGRLALPAAKEA